MDGKVKKKQLRQTISEPHFIIAVGASAGGLEAIHDFFDNVSESANLSFVIIQHLSPDYKSLLVELVAKHTYMKVQEASDGVFIEKGCIYVIPPKKMMTVSEGRLQLTDKEEMDKGPNTAIDVFLLSLAKDKKSQSIAIILSGTGTDGSKGIEAVNRAGGLVMVQEPESAKFDGMPRSAIATGFADYILAPWQMPEEILNYIDDNTSGVFRENKVNESVLEDIFKLIYKNTGCDFHNYKYPTILRRISRRMKNLNLANINDYLALLKTETQESEVLCKDFLIGVTKFFRDKEAFDVLEKDVLTQIVKSKKSGDTIKVWITACSSGEEAYTVAILLTELIRKSKKDITLKLFATDTDTNAIDKATKGFYDLNIAKDVPEYYLENYFTTYDKFYQINPEIRKKIVFARHNIISDPPFIKNDLVTCRNMLIYMNAALQKKVLSTLHFALNPGGYLFLGNTESVSLLNENLEEIDRKWKIFRRIETTSRGVHQMFGGTQFKQYKPAVVPELLPNRISPKDLTHDVRALLCDDLGYVVLYVDRIMDVKDALGDYKRFLSLPDKQINLNLLKLLPKAMAVTISKLIREAWSDGKRINTQRMIYEGNNKSRMLHIIIRPEANSKTGYTAVLLKETEVETQVAVPEATIVKLPEEGEDTFINGLHEELNETKLSLQATIEELETTNEELQSANEEMISSNEELQSSNEELQSLNEELHTLNTEHQIKINELIQLNDDLNNYFRSTDIGQIFLDRNLKIRKFNPAVNKLINLIETDMGRPITDISTNLLNVNVGVDLKAVLESRQILEKEIFSKTGMSYLMKAYPYITNNNIVDGIVLTFVDISLIKNLNEIINGVFDSSQNSIFAFNSVMDSEYAIRDFECVAANRTSELFWKKQMGQIIHHSLEQIFPAAIRKVLFKEFTKVVASGGPVQFELNFENRFFEAVAVKIKNGVAITFIDVTDKKVAEEKLRRNFNELIRAREELKGLNTTLETKIEERTRALSESEERFRLVSKATNDAIVDWRLVSNDTWYSDSFFKLFGYDKKEADTRKYLTTQIHPDDKSRVQETIHQALNSGVNQFALEYRFQKADGSYAVILDRSYVLHDEFGTPYRMLKSMLDITELRNAKQEVVKNIEQREFLAESIPLIVWTADPAGNVTFLNKNFENFTGYPIQKGHGQKWRKHVEPAYLEKIEQAWKAALKKGNDFEVEIKLNNVWGEYRWHLLKARAQIEDGHVAMWVGSLTDIDQQKRVSEVMEQRVQERTDELKKLNRALQRSNNDLQQFASIASHDLKEPIRKIQMYGNLLKNKYLQELDGAAIFTDKIIHSASRMTKLVNDLLSYSKIAEGSFFEQINLNTVINEILEDLELTISEKDARFAISHFPMIEAIPGLIRQLFQNLISNALKFSIPGVRPVISIRSSIIDSKNLNGKEKKDGAFCRICVKDNGIGFDEAYKEKIFTLFQRLHGLEEYEGTGIGLALCKKIVEKHNGLIDANSKPNEGAEFVIVLPLRQETD